MDRLRRMEMRYFTGDLYEATMTDCDVHWSHEWFACCPECGCISTTETDVRRVYEGVYTNNLCPACGYTWENGVVGGDDYNDYEDEDSDWYEPTGWMDYTADPYGYE